MFKIECTHTIDDNGKPFGVAEFIKLFAENEPIFGKTQAALFAGVRIAGKPLEIESADMKILREAIAEPTNGYFLIRHYEAAPFVRAIVEAKES